MTTLQKSLEEAWRLVRENVNSDLWESALKKVVSEAKAEERERFAEILRHPSISALEYGEFEDGEKCWLVLWKKGGYTAGFTLDSALHSAKEELGL